MARLTLHDRRDRDLLRRALARLDEVDVDRRLEVVSAHGSLAEPSAARKGATAAEAARLATAERAPEQLLEQVTCLPAPASAEAAKVLEPPETACAGSKVRLRVASRAVHVVRFALLVVAENIVRGLDLVELLGRVLLLAAVWVPLLRELRVSLVNGVQLASSPGPSPWL